MLNRKYDVSKHVNHKYGLNLNHKYLGCDCVYILTDEGTMSVSPELMVAVDVYTPLLSVGLARVLA